MCVLNTTSMSSPVEAYIEVAGRYLVIPVGTKMISWLVRERRGGWGFRGQEAERDEDEIDCGKAITSAEGARKPRHVLR